MDIDRLHPKEQERCKNKGLCFECGEPGHFASEHRKDNVQKTYQNTEQPTVKTERPAFQGQKYQGKRGKGPQKKMNPGQLRQHIRALIDENFEEDSPEFSEFVKEIEEQGF